MFEGTYNVLRPCLVHPKLKNFLRFLITLNLAAHKTLNIDKK